MGDADGAEPSSKRLRDGDASGLQFTVRKAVAGTAAESFVETIFESASVADLAKRFAEKEGCQPAQITIVSRGVPLKADAALLPLCEKEGRETPVPVVYIVRKPKPEEVSSGPAPAGTASTPAVAAAAAAIPTGTGSSSSSGAAAGPPASAAKAPDKGRRVVLMLRHGQCCHEGEHDSLKELTSHGHKQAEESARYISSLFQAGKLPAKRALLHSTSRRASETAAKLPAHLENLDTWNADLLRETDPTNNPFRAEEVFNRLFASSEDEETFTLIVVAHNNIILYLLMRAAGIPIERAAQAWNLFQLRHASITRIDVVGIRKQVLCVGAAAHISDVSMTWKNISGADMSAWKGGGPERHKFSGRMLLLVRQAASSQQIAAVADHVKGLSSYMISSKAIVTCTSGSQATGAMIAKKFKTAPQIFPDSLMEQPEAAFLQFFTPPEESSRDSVIIVAEDTPLLYWLLRSLGMSAEESQLATSLYSIGHGSVTLINLRSDGSTKVVAVGDTGHQAISDQPTC